MHTPVISVLLSVRNGQAYLADALQSILCQTFQDWECIAVNDGSTDASPEILNQFARQDGRFRVLHNEHNLGLATSLNRALAAARGRYIARMDADDLCRADRLERQLAFLQQHPEADLTACRALLLQGQTILPGADLRRTDAAATRALFLFFNPIVHPCVFARTEAVRSLGYDPDCSCTEDLSLWLRMLEAGKVLMRQPDYLLLYRLHEGQVTATSGAAQRTEVRRLLDHHYTRTLFAPTGSELDLLSRGLYFRDEPDPAALAELAGHIRSVRHTPIAPDDLRYAVWELLLEYRRAGVSAASLLRFLPLLGPVFPPRELWRRRQAASRDAALRREAIRQFTAQTRVRTKEELP